MQPFEHTPPEARDLLGKPIRELGLQLAGSPLEKYVQQLYRELEAKGLSRFRPACYLSDEWSCPDREPIIGIPFYLADPKLQALERSLNDLEDEREIIMYLRHEAGHAFNYAYRLYASPEWRRQFGPFNRRYRDLYRPVPFSRKHVRHIAGWYAQKHPDEAPHISDLVPDAELEDIFLPGPAREGLRPAAEVLASFAKTLTDKIAYWTGLRRSLAKRLVEQIVRRSRELDLFVEVAREGQQLVDVTVLATTLAMNYLQRGKFAER